MSSALDLTCGQDTLLHGETLLVVATGNSQDVSFPLITKTVSFNFSSHAFFIEDANFTFIFDINKFLGPSGGVADVQLREERKVVLDKFWPER